MRVHDLLDGQIIHDIGFGTYKLRGTQGVNAIVNALDVGYRTLDTAINYENEGVVGEALRRSSVARDEIIVTSKLPGRYHGYEDALKAVQESLFRLNVDQIDLYLIHWPNPSQDQYVEAWRALIDAQKAGLIRSIGVCNFLPEHLERLKNETGVLPVVNQIELHPYFNQEAARAYHREHGIITEAWSPLGRASAVIHDALLVDIAQRYNKTVPQIILKWHVQHGVVPIPKSSSVLRQKENLYIDDFELSASDMTLIDGLTREDGRLKDQNPAYFEDH